MVPAIEIETFGMEASDLKALAADDQTFRLYVANGLSTLSERMAAVADHVGAIAKDVAANHEGLIQIDLKGTHGLGDLKDRVAVHDKWVEDIRKSLAEHGSNCVLFDRVATLESALQHIGEDNAARAEMLKGYDEMKKKLDAVAVTVAEGAAAKGQKEKDWKATVTMAGMILTTIFSLIGLFMKTKALP